MRTSASNGSVTDQYVYTGGQLTMMRKNGVNLYFTYDADGSPLTLSYGSATYYYIANLQGDVVGLMNTSGLKVVEYTYDAWGNPLTVTGSMASTLGQYNPLRYRGYVYDTATGLYYLQSRYYNPEIGRFINADGYTSTGQGLLGNNMFACCNNNPINAIDPTGGCTTYRGELIDCGKATCSTSSNYNSDAIHIVIIYDYRHSGFFGIKGEGFRHQGEELRIRLDDTFAVTMRPVTSANGFLKAWNSSDTADIIIVLCHGKPGRLVFGKTGMSVTPVEREKASVYRYFYELKPVDVPLVLLWSCNGATPNADGHSVAEALQEKCGGCVFAVRNGGLSFSYFGCRPELEEGGEWAFFHP